MNPAYRRILPLLALLYLAGCAQQALQPYEPDAAVARLQQMEHWQLRGKAGIKADGKSRSALLNWKQQGEQYSIRLQGPLGMGAVHLHGDQHAVTLDQAGQPPRTADSAEELLQQLLGLRTSLDELSLDDLKYWVRGLPGKSQVSALQVDPDTGRLLGFEQNGWALALDRYRRYQGFLMPGRITIRARAEAHQARPTLTLLVSRWVFPEQEAAAAMESKAASEDSNG